MAQLVQAMVGVDYIMRYPGAFFPVVRAAFNHLTERVIERHAIRRVFMKAFHAAAEMKFLGPKNGAWIGRPPKDGVAR